MGKLIKEKRQCTAKATKKPESGLATGSGFCCLASYFVVWLIIFLSG
jgi:hypothetical protein